MKISKMRYECPLELNFLFHQPDTLLFFKFKKDICGFLKFTVILLLFYGKVEPNIQFEFFWVLC